MTKLKLVTLALVAAAGAAQAQTANTTATSSLNPYMIPPATGYISATLTSTTQPVAAALPSTSKAINSILCSLRDSSGNLKGAQVSVSSTTNRVIVANSGQASGTIAVGDRLNCFISYER